MAQPTVADLASALRKMQSELKSSMAETAALSAEVVVLKQQLAAKAGIIQGAKEKVIVVPPAPPLPLAPPERYFGDPVKFSTFLTQCQLHFLCRPAAFQDPQSRIAFLISYLGGDAATWAIPMVQSDNPLLYQWDEFKEEFGRIFDRRSVIKGKDKELLSLRQGAQELISYITTFNRLCIETQWPKEKQVPVFYQGLREDLKDALAGIEPQPVDITNLIDLVIRLDHRLAERRVDKKRIEGKPSPFVRLDKARVFERTVKNVAQGENEPMQLGRVRGPLTAEEREFRKKNMLCLYCGKAGHILKDCPRISQKTQNKLPGNLNALRSSGDTSEGPVTESPLSIDFSSSWQEH